MGVTLGGTITEVFDHVSSIEVSYVRVGILTRIRESYLSKVSSTEHSKVIVILQSLQVRRHTREEREGKEKLIQEVHSMCATSGQECIKTNG